MKKMFSKFFVTLVILVGALMLAPTVPTQAATKTTKTAVQKKADAETTKIKSYGNYYGWDLSMKQKGATKSKITKRLKLVRTGESVNYVYTQVTQRSGKKYTTYFLRNGKKFNSSEVKQGLKKYKKSSCIKALLKNRAKSKTDGLAKYGKSRGWSSKTSFKSSTARSIATMTFMQPKKATVKITVTRNIKGPKISFILNGKKSNEKKIKTYLEKYKKTTSGDTNKDPDPVSNATLIALAKSASNSLIATGKANNWLTTTSGDGTACIKIKFQNSEYNFIAMLKAIDGGNGKGIIRYSLKGKSDYTTSSREEIISWIKKYAVVPEPDDPTDPEDGLVPASAKDLQDAAVKALARVNAKAAETDWTYTKKSDTGASIEELFENSKYKFKLKIEASGEYISTIKVKYILFPNPDGAGTERDWDDIAAYFETYRAAKKDDEETPTPEPGPAEEQPIPDEQLSAAATAAMEQLDLEATQDRWSYTEIENTGAKVQQRFENDRYSFYAAVEAKAIDGQIALIYSVQSKLTNQPSIVTKDFISNWLTAYKVDSTGSSSEPANPDDDKPTAPTEKPSTNGGDNYQEVEPF